MLVFLSLAGCWLDSWACRETTHVANGCRRLLQDVRRFAQATRAARTQVHGNNDCWWLIVVDRICSSASIPLNRIQVFSLNGRESLVRRRPSRFCAWSKSFRTRETSSFNIQLSNERCMVFLEISAYTKWVFVVMKLWDCTMVKFPFAWSVEDSYGTYAELRHKVAETISCLADDGNKDKLADLAAQRDYMDMVCRSFASRLERRRNLMITSVRYYRFIEQVGLFSFLTSLHFNNWSQQNSETRFSLLLSF